MTFIEVIVHILVGKNPDENKTLLHFYYYYYSSYCFFNNKYVDMAAYPILQQHISTQTSEGH